jgi:hypothetical protein
MIQDSVLRYFSPWIYIILIFKLNFILIYNIKTKHFFWWYTNHLYSKGIKNKNYKIP